MNQGYIKLYRKLETWDWYKSPNVLSLWIHILMKANFTDKKWQGQLIKRGSFITGLNALSTETGLSIQQVRTALDKLQSTNNITSKSTNKYRIITVLDYNDYQSDNKQDNKQITSKQQTNNNNEVIKELKNEKKVIKKQAKKVYFDNEELNTLFYEFLLMRKKIKKPMTDKAIELAIGKLNKQSDNIKTQMLEYSIMNNYQGLFIPKEQTESKQERKFGNG